MRRHFIFIINPISGTKSKTDLKKYIIRKTTEENIPFDIYPSVASGDYSFLNSIIKEKGTTDVIIAGGDGTVSQVVHSLASCNVNFGIIPCGSGNGLAFTAGIPSQHIKALEIAFRSKPVAIDGFTVNKQFACMLAGLGFDAKIAHDFANQPKRGLATYTKQVIKNFFGAPVYKFAIESGPIKFTTDAYFISIANSNQFGNNVTIAPEASLTDGLLDIVIVAGQNKLSLLLQTFLQISGNNKLQVLPTIDEKKGVIYFQANKLTISNLSDAPLHIDGDPVACASKLEIKIIEKCFRLIQPV